VFRISVVWMVALLGSLLTAYSDLRQKTIWTIRFIAWQADLRALSRTDKEHSRSFTSIWGEDRKSTRL